MKLLKVFFLFNLLGGDYGLELASLEAFPTQAYGVDGRAKQVESRALKPVSK